MYIYICVSALASSSGARWLGARTAAVWLKAAGESAKVRIRTLCRLQEYQAPPRKRT